MTNFDLAVDYLLANEGGLVDNPNDPGGITKYGISLRFLRSVTAEKNKSRSDNSGGVLVTAEDIKNLTYADAKEMYKSEFWNHARFAEINNQCIGNYIFDMACNMGISPAIKCVQRAIWSMHGKRSITHDDGILGDETLFLINESGLDLLAPLRSERAGYYRDIIARNPVQIEFLEGWLNRAYGV